MVKKLLQQEALTNWAVLQNDRSFEDGALNPSRVKLFKISSVERTVEIPWLCAFQFFFETSVLTFDTDAKGLLPVPPQ